jgi:ABC-type sugar transport system permease subunit
MNVNAIKKKRKHKDNASALLMILPALLLLTIFVFIPLIMAIFRSLYNFGSGEPSSFIGFSNYIKILKNSVFIQSLKNVLVLTAVITIVEVVLAFLFAHVLVRIKGKYGIFVRTIIYLPYLISGIVVSVIFTLMTTYNGGIINSILAIFDKNPIAFNNDVFWSPLSIIIPTIWIGFGYNTLVMYSGLINVPKDYYEAAQIDGAGFWASMFHITLPCMKNYFILLIVTLVVANLQMYEIPMMMTNGQPANRTMTPVLYLMHSRSNGNISDSEITAAALLIMIIILIINSAVFSLFKTKKKDSWEM